MPQLCNVTTEDLRDFLIGNFGREVKTEHLLKAVDKFNITYQTVTKYLSQYKVKRGVWNLTVAEAREQLEQTVTLVSPEVKELVPHIY